MTITVDVGFIVLTCETKSGYIATALLKKKLFLSHFLFVYIYGQILFRAIHTEAVQIEKETRIIVSQNFLILL